MISNILSEAKKIDIFDSVYSDIEENTEALVSGMFDQPVELKVYSNLEKQKGSMDCGVYCIAVCASLLHRAPMKISTPKAHFMFWEVSRFTFPMQVDSLSYFSHAVIFIYTQSSF